VGITAFIAGTKKGVRPGASPIVCVYQKCYRVLMGRPFADKTVGRRSEVLPVRLAPVEVEWISAAAEAQGISLSEFIRGTAVSASAAYLEQLPGTSAGAATPNTVPVGSLNT
jgi:hypothetical protein